MLFRSSTRANKSTAPTQPTLHYLPISNLVIASVIMMSLTLFLAGCRKTPELAHPTTIKDLMKSIVDPSGEFLFASIRETSDARGVSRQEPKTDAEWDQVRHHATVLLEAPNLITMEGRKVARPGQHSPNPLIEKEPDEVQRLIDAERAEFLRRAVRLQDAASAVLQAADAKDAGALFKAIERVDKACESCHLHYWYPNDSRARQAALEEGVEP